MKGLFMSAEMQTQHVPRKHGPLKGSSWIWSSSWFLALPSALQPRLKASLCHGLFEWINIHWSYNCHAQQKKRFFFFSGLVFMTNHWYLWPWVVSPIVELKKSLLVLKNTSSFLKAKALPPDFLLLSLFCAQKHPVWCQQALSIRGWVFACQTRRHNAGSVGIAINAGVATRSANQDDESV